MKHCASVPLDRQKKSHQPGHAPRHKSKTKTGTEIGQRHHHTAPHKAQKLLAGISLFNVLIAGDF